MNVQRREFLKKTALGIGGAVAGAAGWAAASKPASYDPYELVPLGKTGMKMSRFCMGTGMRGGNRESNHTRMGKEKFGALIHGAYDRGVRVYDLADLYGTNPYVVPALKEIPRDKYVIISKIWFQRGGIPEPERPDADVVVARFLKEMGTDYIDLILLHCVTSEKWPEDLRKQMDILAKLKQKGDIRAHGVSCHSLGALKAAADEPWVDSVHARINPFGISMDDKDPEKVLPVLKKMHAAGKGVVGMKIIGEGKYRDDDAKKNEAARFILQSGCVDIMNIGFEKEAEIDDFAERVKKVPKQA
jgi:aryl-alcohol dehydrogenase-like predicted oxidoreductase